MHQNICKAVLKKINSVTSVLTCILYSTTMQLKLDVAAVFSF